MISRKSIQLFSILLIAGLFTSVSSISSRLSDNGIARLTNAQFKQEAAKPNRIIIDVRTAGEYKEGHIEGAVLMDFLETENFLKQVLSLDKGKNYLLYCRTGKRSLNAARIMKKEGFKNISDLEHGISKWDGPIVTDRK